MVLGPLVLTLAALRSPLVRGVRSPLVRAVRSNGRSVRSALSHITTDASGISQAELQCSAEPGRMVALREETRSIWPGGAHMVSGAQQGLLLHTLVGLARAPRVLEVGCFTGYAALWMALALPEGGTLLSLERDERAAEVARRHLDAAGVGDRVELRMGDALESLAALAGNEEPFDIVFLDADKKRCEQYYELLMERELLAPHSLLLVDNVLWKGHVLDRLDNGPPTAEASRLMESRSRRSTAIRDALHDFSMHLERDRRMRQLMLPLRDGLTWAQPAAPWEDGEDDVAPRRNALARSEAPTDESPRAVGDVDVGNDARLRPYLELVGSREPSFIRHCRAECSGGEADDAGQIDDELQGDRREIDGALQGRLLHMLVRLARASHVLEVGGTGGYATLWMALALPDRGGTLLSLQQDEESLTKARKYIEAAGAGERVQLRVGEAELSGNRAAGGAAVAGSDAPFDLALWHLDHRESAVPCSGQLHAILGRLADHGTLVVLRPGTPDEVYADTSGGDVLREVLSSRALQVVTLPSPDGDGGLVSLVRRRDQEIG